VRRRGGVRRGGGVRRRGDVRRRGGVRRGGVRRKGGGGEGGVSPFRWSRPRLHERWSCTRGGAAQGPDA